jgi:hypothetical protein
MDGLARVDCPHCSESTSVLIPSETERVGVAGVQSPWPPAADTAVRSRCPGTDRQFVVFLRRES